MKKRSNILALVLAVLMLALCLSACGASKSASYDTAAAADFNYSYAAPETPMEAPMVTEMAETDAAEEESFSTSSLAAGGQLDAEPVVDYAEKIIYSGSVSIQTTAFDDALTALEQAVKTNGGFIQDSNVEGYTQTYSDGTSAVVDRWAYYTVRIPADKFEVFMALTDGIGNVTNSSRTAENVTSQYTDYEARLDSLNIQEERLLAMLEKSGDLESLITLEARLSEVRYEIESIERNLRNLDQRLAYSTVNLTLQEVEVYTPTVTVTRTFGEKLSDAFSDGWTGFVRGLQNLCIALAAGLPTLVLMAVLAVAVILVVRRSRRAAKTQKTPPSQDEEQK